MVLLPFLELIFIMVFFLLCSWHYWKWRPALNKWMNEWIFRADMIIITRLSEGKAAGLLLTQPCMCGSQSRWFALEEKLPVCYLQCHVTTTQEACNQEAFPYPFLCTDQGCLLKHRGKQNHSLSPTLLASPVKRALDERTRPPPHHPAGKPAFCGQPLLHSIAQTKDHLDMTPRLTIPVRQWAHQSCFCLCFLWDSLLC